MITEYDIWFNNFSNGKLNKSNIFDLNEIKSLLDKYEKNTSVKRKIDTYNTYISIEITNMKRNSLLNRKVSIETYFKEVMNFIKPMLKMDI